MHEMYAEWMKAGKLKVSSDWNKDLGIKFTLQDPCQIVRKSLGDPAAEALRYAVKACVGEENFVEMYPNRSQNYCCGGGGGYLQSGYVDERRHYGARKLQQIDDTGATYVIAPCHNCHSQIHDIGEHAEAKFHTVHLWTIMALAMGCLGPKERTYLGSDLAEVGLK
jgi:Fe-S oxidoreductase